MTDPTVDALAAALENDIRELRGAQPGELARRLIERGWARADEYKEATDAAMNFGDGYAEGRAVALADAGYVVVRAEDVTAAYTLGWRDHEAGISPRPPRSIGTDLDPAIADAGYVLVTEASLARALALAEVGCWANPPIHGAEQDAEVHQRDAAAVMGRLRETP